MKISPALKAHRIREHQLETKLQKEIEQKRELIAKIAEKEIAIVIYEKRLQELYMIHKSRLGKNIDREV